MQRTVSYRGFEIYIELRPTSKDMLEPWFRIDGATRDPGAAVFGTHTYQGSRRPVFPSLGTSLRK